MKKVFFSFYLFVIAALLFLYFVYSPIVGQIIRRNTPDELIEYNRKLAKGVFFLMEQDLLRLPEDKWQQRITVLKSHFGYGIGLTALDDLPLDAEQKRRLHQGDIVITGYIDYFYYQVAQSRWVLSKGPFSALEPDMSRVNYLILAGVTLAMALPTVIWIMPFWRRLRRISSAAMAFGCGDFNVRARIGRRSSLAPIATAFNTMADRIQQLITSHKELTNAVSHEFRSPIARIRFGLTMLSSSTLPEKKQHYINGIQIDVNELEGLVSELLTYARFDREKPCLRFSRHPVIPWLKDLLDNKVPISDGPDYGCSFQVDDPSRTAWFDPRHMGRAVDNLVQNALRCAQRRVHVSLEQCNGEAVIHVDDDGPGIPLEDRKRIFEPFTRLDSSRSRISGGHGLGLAIVRRIAIWHGGSVAVFDSPMGGARFSIRWPGFAQQMGDDRLKRA
jgi:signal transduction histidine kinase